MRPRINKTFGIIKYSELNDYLYKNHVYSLTVHINESTFVYDFIIMFRKNKEQPEKLFIEVSKSSKNVLKAWTDKGINFKSINDLKTYTKFKHTL